MKTFNETIFHKNHIVSVTELSTSSRKVSFQNLMKEFCEDYTISINHCKRSEADIFIVVWYQKNGDLHIDNIYNQDTREIYWGHWWDRTEEIPNPYWKYNDEVIYCSLLDCLINAHLLCNSRLNKREVK